jgi:hypothetical protein
MVLPQEFDSEQVQPAIAESRPEEASAAISTGTAGSEFTAAAGNTGDNSSPETGSDRTGEGEQSTQIETEGEEELRPARVQWTTGLRAGEFEEAPRFTPRRRTLSRASSAEEEEGDRGGTLQVGVNPTPLLPRLLAFGSSPSGSSVTAVAAGKVQSVGFAEQESDEEEMEEPSSKLERFSGRTDGPQFEDWEFRFRTWQKEKRQKNALFSEWHAFELMPKHLEHEALRSYMEWTVDHDVQLAPVEQYWVRRSEMIMAVKESAGVQQGGGAGGGSISIGGTVNTPAAGSGPGALMTPMTRTAAAVLQVDATLGAPPVFQPLQEFLTWLKAEYGGIQRSKLDAVKDFKHQTRHEPCTLA